MPFDTQDEDVEFSIRFALTQFPYKPPRRFDLTQDERDRYYGAVAKAVRLQLELTYEFVRKPQGDNFGPIWHGKKKA